MGRKKRRETAFEWYIYQRGWLKFFFYDFLSFSFLVFGFWSLVSNCRVTRVARGVLWVGLGLYTTQGKFALDWTTGTCYLFFIDEMGGWMEGPEGRAGGVRTLFAENREPTEICHCWPRGGLFFCFYEVGWLVVLSYLTLPLS